MMDKLTPVDGSEIERQLEEGRQRRRRWEDEAEGYLLPEDVRAGVPGRFCGLSVLGWCALAALANVPAVPARQIGTITLADLGAFWDRNGELPQERLEAFTAAAAEVRAGDYEHQVVRTDCCAPETLKAHMAAGRYPRPPGGSSPIELLADLRLAEILGDDPRRHVPIVARPWIEDFETVPGTPVDDPYLMERTGWRPEDSRYPVEFRVYFGGRLQPGALAVSAYYVQAPLGDEWQEHAVRAVRLAERMLTVAGERGIEPWLPVYEQAPAYLPGPHGTLDFALTRQGPLVLIEGGPPNTGAWGAHPCFFEDRPIGGVALRYA